MISHTKDKKKLKFGSVWLWCIGEGYEQKENKENFLDAIFSKNGETTGFIFEFDKTVNEMLSYIEKAKEKVQYIYIVTDDDSKRRSLEKNAGVLRDFLQFKCVWLRHDNTNHEEGCFCF